MNFISLFSAQAEIHKNDIAVVDFNGRRSTTYEQLDLLSSLVAGKLIDRGCEKGNFIIINMERRMEYMAAYLGVLKAGCAIVPVVPEYPEERINYIKKNCEAAAVIGFDFFDDIDDYPAYSEPAENNAPAMLVYTSGSTGNPKGILHSSGDIARAALRHREFFDGISDIVFGATTPFSFMAHIFEYTSVWCLGGTVHILPDEVRKSAKGLAAYFSENGVTIAWIPPQMLKIFKNIEIKNSRFQCALCGGERLSNTYSDKYIIRNVYGMTEFAGIVTSFRLDREYENTPIGKALDRVKVFIGDENGNVISADEGEIWAELDSDFSYFKDKERTDAILKRTADGKALMRTGDIGRLDENGNLLFVNRNDWMVKVNGQRVETLEIESQLQSMAEIENAAVKAFVDSNSQTYLAAYYVSGGDTDERKIRHYLSEKLPPYMIPRFFVRLDEMPKNLNGKLDRKALREPDASMYKTQYAEPENETEERLCAGFEEVLSCGTVGTGDDFFALGGDSIKVLLLIEKTKLDFLTPDMILSGRTPKNIALLCEAANGSAAAVHYEAIPEICPLSDSQRGVYLECAENPDSVMYNIPMLCILPEKTDKARFASAVKTAAKKHKALNVTIGLPDAEPSMLFAEKEIVIEEKTVQSLENECKSFVKPFDLEKGPLYRFEICQCGDKTAFLFDIHHIIFDGTSAEKFISDIAKAYTAGDCDDERLTLFDVALSEKNAEESSALLRAREFFREKLDGTDCDSRPVPDRVSGEKADGAGRIVFNTDGKFALREVLDFTRKNAVTENTLFLGAFAYTLAKFNGSDEASFCSVNNGRHDLRLSSSVGMFVKTLPLYFNIDDNSEVGDFLSYVQDYFFKTMQSDCVSFGELNAEYGVGTDVVFVYQSELFSGADIPEGRISVEMLETGDSQSDLDMMILKTETGFEIMLHYKKSLYTEELMKHFTNMYINVLSSMLECGKLCEIKFTDSGDRQLLENFNRTEKKYDSDRTIVDLFRMQAKKTPDKVCLVFKENSYTYREVDEITDRLAKYLVRNGISREKVVGVLIERSEYMLICSLGILKAGGAYLPLDPSYPPERLNFMVSDSGAVMLITTPELSGIIDSSFKGMRMLTQEIKSLGEENITLEAPKTDDLFVMLYTSGSTGTPKGVMFEHRNALVSVEFFRSYYSMDEGTRLASYASYGFDAHIVDIYPPVICGGTLHVIAEEIRLDLIAVRDYFNKNGITHSVMTTQVGRQFALMGGFESLKHLSVAGEKLTPLEVPQGFNMYNLYGPTEGSVITSAFLMDKYYKDVPIGKAVDNLKLYVTDKCSRLLPAGATGELWISGTHVTRGYLNRPEKTKEAYGENPFENTKGYERIYRTGDIVRLLSDGNLQFIGRRDGQVKIRGFRIELTEVEEVIRRFPKVRDATVAAFDDKGGGKYICAYVVSDSEISQSELAEFIRREKPPYMVPAVIMQIDRIPLNQNHKVNKRALPVPKRVALDMAKPENDAQQAVFDIVSSVIGHSEFGINTSIYEAGLSSVGAVKLNVELAEKFGVHLRISDIKENDTVAKLEKILSGGEKTEEYEILSDYPITQTQSGIFVECMSMPDSTVYNIPVIAKIGEKVDVQRLSRAIKEAVDAHCYVKTKLITDSSGNIRASRNDTAEAEVAVIECEKLPDVKSLIRPHKLLGESLYRIEIYVTKDGNYLLMDFHHIICDGTSEAILLRDISRAYSGEKLEKEKFSGYEAALEEGKMRNSGHYEKSCEYWKKLLTGCENECLPKKEPEEAGGAGSVSVLSDNLEVVRRFCEKNKFSMNAFFNAAFSFTLSRFSGNEYPVYSTVYNGRNDSRLSDSVTMLVRTIPVVRTVGDEASVRELVSKTQAQLLDAMTNDGCSFAELSNSYGVKADIIFVYQGDEFVFDTVCGEKTEFLDVSFTDAKAPISVNVYIKDGKFEFAGEYRRDMFSRELVYSMLDSLAVTVSEFTGKEMLSEVSMLSERGMVVYDRLNDNDFAVRDVCAHQLFEESAEKYADSTALICAGEKLTYRELNEKANILAGALVKMGVKADTIVGFVLDRDLSVFISEIGIMKAGGAFLPMIPSYPDERIEYCLENSESPFVITTEAIKADRPELFGEEKSYKTLTVEELLSGDGKENLNLDISPEQLAYCIYTSGSTGKPKGVIIKHSNFSNFIQTNCLKVDYYMDENARGAEIQVGSVSFDISLYEIYLPLCKGKCLCVATEEEVHNPFAIKDLIIRNNVQMMLCTPSLMNNMMTFPEFVDVMKNMKSVMLGAEAFPAALYKKMREASPELQILNGYGPTETTICCSVKELHSGTGITIGRPTANVKFFVTDKFGHILPPYASGELIICGKNVSRGYIKLPEKTKASFFEFMGLPAYHSGDLVRLNGDAEIDFSGRIDNQVKLRGFRVELDEIEKAICSFDKVRQSKVLVRNNGSEDFLVGFFTAEEKVDTDKLTEHLKSILTYYMVPAIIVQLDKMPLTPNGKIDKNGLPEVQKQAKKKEGRRAPKKSLEQRLCELFASVLGTEEVFADDNFFELGGTSLTASKVTMLLMSDGVEVKYGDIFDNPTPEELASFIEKRDASKTKTEEKQITSAETTRPALKYNMVRYASEAKREPLGNVLLTGSVGFLGIHVLKELLEIEKGHIWCLVRRGSYDSAEIRLKTMLVYYFSSGFEEELRERISIVEADITDTSLFDVLGDIPFDTVINCAACVKHFSDSDILEKINVSGVKNLIEICKRKNAKLIQVSTVSVPGIHTPETYENQVRMHENELFVIDDMDNKYGISKYHAELAMLDAIEGGMRGKIIRVGNLMGRHSDGEFQANMETNMFLSGIRGFATMGMYPISHMTDPMRFSPVDCTARAVVLLSGVNDKFTAFNADNRYGFDEMKIIDSCNRNGIKILPADDEYYYAEYNKKLSDDRVNGKLNGLAAYDIKDAHAVDTDNLFTTNILYRIGFSWPLVDDTYLDRAINSILTLDYFDMDSEPEDK